MGRAFHRLPLVQDFDILLTECGQIMSLVVCQIVSMHTVQKISLQVGGTEPAAPSFYQVPAVAASGMITANTMVPIWKHWQLLDSLA